MDRASLRYEDYLREHQLYIYQVGYGVHIYCETYIRLTALCPGLTRWAGTRKVNPIWILLEQETVGGSGISWAICKSVFYTFLVVGSVR